MIRFWLPAISIFVLLGLSSARAEAAPQEIRIPTHPAWNSEEVDLGRKPDVPRLVLALSGGGLRGLAHIGVLQALEQAGIKPYGIAGVSIGSLVAGLYCEGYTPEEITEGFHRLELESMLEDEPERRSMILARKQELSRHLLEIRLERDFSPVIPGAITTGQALYQQLLNLTLDLVEFPTQEWSQLPVRFATLATDLNTGEPVEFHHGDPGVAIRASMAVPLFLDPLVLDSLVLIDGGIYTNIPVDLARELGGDVIIAVDVSASLHHIQPPCQPWIIVDQVTTILELEATENSLQRADLALTPNLPTEDITTENYGAVIDSGSASMQRLIPQLRELLRPPSLPDDSTLIRVDSVRGLLALDDPLPIDVSGLLTLAAVRKLIRGRFERNKALDAWAEYDSTFHVLEIKNAASIKVNKVVIQGDSLVTAPNLSVPLNSLVGSPFNAEILQHRLRASHRCLRQAGYPLAQLTVKAWDNSSGTLTIELFPGILDSIAFVGLKRLKPRSLVYETPLVIGRPLRKAEIIKSVSSLYATGLFRSVMPEIKPSAIAGRWRLVFHVLEQPPPLRLGLAYLAEEGAQGFAEYSMTWRPFLPTRTILFAGVGERDRDYHLSFHVDKVSKWPIIADVKLSYADRIRILYDNQHKVTGEYFDSRWGAMLDIGGLARSWGLFAFTLRAEEHWTKSESIPQQYLLSAFGLKVGLDTQDRFPYPQQGFLLEGAVESAGKHLASDVSFNKLWCSAESYVPLARRFTAGFRLAGGTADRTTPRDEQFRLGGIHQFPGLHLDEKVGLIQTFGGVELRYDLLSKLLADAYCGIRADIGGSWEDPGSHLKRDNILSSFAVYFALDTILGPIHLQWGRLNSNLDIPSQNLIYIQAGNSF